MALRKACAKVLKRKREICALHKLDPTTTSLDQAAALAVGSRIALTGFACVGTYHPSDDAAMEHFKYWVYGASVVECEVDTRSGEYQFLHASVCLDVGRVKSMEACLFYLTCSSRV